MEVLLNQFIKALTQSGLMTSQQVEAFIEKLPPEKKPEDGKTLAQELVRHKKLTKFQAQAVYQGKTKGLTLGDYVVLDRIGQGRYGPSLQGSPQSHEASGGVEDPACLGHQI